MKVLRPISFLGVYFNVSDAEKFNRGMRLIVESLHDKGATLFMSDNLITWNKNYSFLREEFFTDLIKDEKLSAVEKSTIWRTYILLYFAKLATKAEGDFLELGCHTGNTAHNVVKRIDFKSLGKHYYLYDLFEWNEGDEHTRLPGHKNETMFSETIARFEHLPFVHVIKGSVPQSFSQGFPKKVAFAHIDMNHPLPEAGALTRILPILSPGGAIVFDDYGWWGYSAQKIALDPIIKTHGFDILELPTGQALLMNPSQ